MRLASTYRAARRNRQFGRADVGSTRPPKLFRVFDYFHRIIIRSGLATTRGRKRQRR